MKHKIICGDCIEVMKEMESESINLVIADAPYFRIKKDEWDNQYKRFEDYLNWIERVGIEIKRVLRDNGSLYFFGDDERIAYVQIRLDEHFTFLNHLVWYKINNLPLKYAHNHRKYAPMSERILFYSIQDKTGLDRVKSDVNNFSSLRKYFYELLCFIGLTKKEIIDRIGQGADHCFRYGSTQWELPTKKTYQELIDFFGIDKWKGFREYEDLRIEYEDLRRVFNYQSKIHEIISEPIIQQKENTKHSTTKPERLIKTLIRVSSNEYGTILDPFLGSGTTMVAAERLGRNSIGIEISKEYCELSYQRLLKEVQQQKWNRELSTIEKVGF